MPATDEERIALVERNVGNTVVELYLLYSDANEPEHPEADSLAQEMYDGLEAMIHEMTDSLMGNKYLQPMQDLLIKTALTVAEEPMQSLVEDVTNWSSASFADRTDDLHLTLRINEARKDAISHTYATDDDTLYDVLGRPMEQPTQHGVYIQNGKKIIR